jgi:hypothetical protein
MSTALGHGSIAFGRTISSFLQGCFGIFNPILLNRNSKGKLRQLHSSMDRFWKNKSFFIPGWSGIFNPNTLTPFLMNCTSIAAAHVSLSEDEQFLYSWVFWNLQPKYVKPKFVGEIRQLHPDDTYMVSKKTFFIPAGCFGIFKPNF